MSALPPEANIRVTHRHVCFGPFSDSCIAASEDLFDHLVGKGLQFQRNVEPLLLGAFGVDYEFEFGRQTISRAPIGEVIRGVLPFLILLLIVLMIITYVPPLTLWLPHAVYGS